MAIVMKIAVYSGLTLEKVVRSNAAKSGKKNLNDGQHLFTRFYPLFRTYFGIFEPKVRLFPELRWKNQ